MLLAFQKYKTSVFLLPPYNKTEERRGVKRRRRGKQGWMGGRGKEGSKDEKGKKGRGNETFTILHGALFLLCIWDLFRQNEKGNHNKLAQDLYLAH